MTTETIKIVVLNDGATYSGVEGATLQVITDSQHDELCEGAEPNDLEDALLFNLAPLPELVKRTLELIAHYHKPMPDGSVGMQSMTPAQRQCWDALIETLGRCMVELYPNEAPKAHT